MNICYEDTGFLHNYDEFTYFGEKSFMLYRCLNSNFPTFNSLPFSISLFTDSMLNPHHVLQNLVVNSIN